MALLKRFGFFFFGLSIGIVFLVFFFKKKSEETGTEFCYFPNCRTLKDIRSKPISYSEAISALIKNGELDTVDIRYILKEGDVDFGRSKTKTIPCKTYVVESTLKDKDVSLHVKNCVSEVVLEKLEYTNSTR